MICMLVSFSAGKWILIFWCWPRLLFSFFYSQIYEGERPVHIVEDWDTWFFEASNKELVGCNKVVHFKHFKTDVLCAPLQGVETHSFDSSFLTTCWRRLQIFIFPNLLHIVMTLKACISTNYACNFIRNMTENISIGKKTESRFKSNFPTCWKYSRNLI